MAKYLKENEIKAGMTIYIVHPKFMSITKAFITKKPFIEKIESLGSIDKYKKFSYFGEYLEISKSFNVVKTSGYITDWYERIHESMYHLSDCGIPNKNGVFKYNQMRRAFKTLNGALKYLKDNRTSENIKKWDEEDEEKLRMFGDW